MAWNEQDSEDTTQPSCCLSNPSLSKAHWHRKLFYYVLQLWPLRQMSMLGVTTNLFLHTYPSTMSWFSCKLIKFCQNFNAQMQYLQVLVLYYWVVELALPSSNKTFSKPHFHSVITNLRGTLWPQPEVVCPDTKDGFHRDHVPHTNSHHASTPRSRMSEHRTSAA